MILPRARARFFAAIAAGLAACRPESVPPPVDALDVPRPDAGVVAVPATATTTAITTPSAATSATASATAPPTPSATAVAVTTATAATATPTSTSVGPPSTLLKCAPPDKATRTCYARNTVPSTGGNVPTPGPYTGWDKNGCFAAREIVGSCNGIRDAAGPYVIKGQCCYDVCQGTPAPCGRPLVVDGAPRVARVVARDDWSSNDAPGDPSAPLAARAALAWREDAALEHASIASFARLALDLLALGAPPDLVAGAGAAALDEVAHAKACFAIAARLGGTGALGPAPLALEGVRPLADLAEVARDTAAQSCVGETVAALALARAAERCPDPALAAVIARVAEDELGHAALGWQIVAWACAAGGAEVRAAVRDALVVGDYAAPAFDDDADADAWRRHGRATREDMELAVRDARALVADAAARL